MTETVVKDSKGRSWFATGEKDWRGREIYAGEDGNLCKADIERFHGLA